MLKKLFWLLFFILSCTIIFAQTSITYIKTDSLFFNPERGFTSQRSSALSSTLINSLKSQNISVIQRIYTIPQYNKKPLPETLLNTVQSDLDVARENGIKLILRFSYTNNQNGADAALDTILLHISQIKPILQKNDDVILYMEAGFIGAWGEWYYSSHHLNNTNDRRTVLYALLDALPKDRAVLVRTPDYKRIILGDNSPLTNEEAYNGSYKARIGAHNDCFLASANDYGTYLDNDIEGDKTYLNLDNRFVPQGGETCCDCGYDGCANALTNLNRMHWSILNMDYHPDVLKRWVNEGCMEEIKRRLGYRFSLINATISDSIKPKGIFHAEVSIRNEGFASPFNPHSLEVILRNETTNKKYRLITSEDPRFWFSGDSINIDITGGIPEDISEGKYESFLYLADPQITLHDNPSYAIRFANKNTWEDSTGYNSLLHTIYISKNATGQYYNGNKYFEPYISNNGGGGGSSDKIQIDGYFNDWSKYYQLDIGATAEDTGDAITPSSDLVDLWGTSDENNLYLSYSLNGNYNSNYFYHIFFDTDKNTETGFHSDSSLIGADYMIENSSLWKYSGTNGSWGWSLVGDVVLAVGNQNVNRVEIGFAKSLLGANVNSISFIFNVNENNNAAKDDYAPNDYRTNAYNYDLVTSVNEVITESLIELPKIEAFPNPFNNSVRIIFNIDESKVKEAYIFDVLGRRIKNISKNLVNRTGISWNGRNDFNIEVGSGIYFVVVQTNDHIYSKKILFMK